MKKTNQVKLLLLGAVILLASCSTSKHSQQNEQGYTLKAKIENNDHYTLYLAYPTDKSYVIDTNYIMENGWAIFKGKVSEPVVASFGSRRNPELAVNVGMGMIPGPSLNFVLTNEVIKIEGQANTIYNSKVTGGKANKEWLSIKPRTNQLQQESWESLKSAYARIKKGGDSSVLNVADQLREKNLAETKNLQEQFIAANPGSLVSMYFLANLVNEISLDELKADYARLDDTFKNSMYAKRITDKITQMDATAVGKEAIPIQKKDMNGNPVNLQTLRGKYVLIDFWGSWCGPCRASHPHLKELYAKYKDKGFEILGIAQEERDNLADNIRIWKDAVKEDGLPWIQVLNNQDRDKFDAVKAYGITAFPTKILLDKDGKIIGRYVGDEGNFDQKLKEIFGF